MNFSNLTRSAGKLIQNNAPAILTAVATGGVIATVVSAVRATKPALQVLQHEAEDRQYKYELDENEVPKVITKTDIVKLTWQFYIPTVIIGGVTLVCIVGAQSINSRRTTALISAYSMAEVAHREYKEKATQYLTKGEQQKVYDEIVEDRMKSSPVSNQEVIVLGAGTVLCYDTHSDRYFNSDMETIRKAVNDINAHCLNDGYASHNDFYSKIGLKHTPEGEMLGWTASHLIDPIFTSKMTDDSRPCLALTYLTPPTEKYDRIW